MEAHHTTRGFRNPWPDSEPPGWRDVVRWSIQRRHQTLPPDPKPGTFPLAQPTFAQRVGAGELSVTWIGHATVLLQIGGINVLTDPIWSDRASPLSFAGPKRFVPAGVGLAELPPIDVVLISHNHYDHLDRLTVRALARQMPRIEWVTPLALSALLRRWGAARVREMDWWENDVIQTPQGELSIACVPAQHFGARGLGDRGRTLWCSWVVWRGDRRVFFAGDTAYHPEFGSIGERHGPFDLLMLPIGAYEPRWFMHTVHMNPPETLRAYADLARLGGVEPIFVPIHWGTFRLTDEAMTEPPVWTARLWREAGYDPQKLWLLQHGETRKLAAS